VTSNGLDIDVSWIFRAGAKSGFTEVGQLQTEVAFSFRDLSDLSQLPNSRGAFRNVVAAGYPDLRSSQLPLRISQIYWFVHRIAPGDQILFVDEARETAHHGTVASRYRYAPHGGPFYNRRAVRWNSTLRFRDAPSELVELWRAQTGIIPVGGLSRLETT
jgi:predicted Mrr-cat superfamily restriction endonuclease